MDYDFGGWATRNNIECSDGRVIMKDAFKQNDGQKVPLVWNHQHDDPNEVLGHALLENREEGVYAYCKFNDTDSGRQAKALVVNGDVDKLSIYANKLKSQMNNVVHGCIREVSLVLAGANPGAFIDSVITHSDESGDEEEAVIYTDEDLEIITDKNEVSEESKAQEENPENNKNESEKSESENSEKDSSSNNEESSQEESESDDEVEHSDKSMDVEDVFADLKDDDKNVIYSLIGEVEKTGKVNANNEKFVKVFEGLTDEQQEMVYALVGKAADEYDNKNKDNKEGEKEIMKHNVFEKDEKNDTLVHSEIVADALADAKKYGSMRESFLEHAAANNIQNVDYLFPEATNVNQTPEFVKRDTGWVEKVMGAVHHSPFSRIKSQFADITADDARAKGYVKGNLKKDEVFTLLKRSTTPTTVYKKQKLDRDDVVDITDFDVVSWIKGEMRMMLDEELARAFLIGDGRLSSSDDKINEQNIRPIYNDADLYTVKVEVDAGENATAEAKTKAFIKAVIKNRKEYKGTGSPTLYTTEDVVSDCLLLEDANGRFIYDTIDKLKNTLRVADIVTVPVMEGAKGAKGGDLIAILVNLADYNVGADKGGAVNMFDDFDIDYNAQKYLIETRCSGALTKPYSAIAFEFKKASV